jgi:hypothetical protein
VTKSAASRLCPFIAPSGLPVTKRGSERRD